MNLGFPPFGRGGRIAAAVGLAAAIAVASTGATDAATLLQKLFGGGKSTAQAPASDPNTIVIDPSQLTAPAYCPELHLAVGGEAFATFAPGHDGDQKYVRYLGSVTDTARECHDSSDELAISMKIGIAGRVVAGPQGIAGKVTLPFRVTIMKQHGSKVLFNKTYTTTVTVSAPSFTSDFSEIIDPVNFKRGEGDEDLIIYVGFDAPTRQPAPTG